MLHDMFAPCIYIRAVYLPQCITVELRASDLDLSTPIQATFLRILRVYLLDECEKTYTAFNTTDVRPVPEVHDVVWRECTCTSGTWQGHLILSASSYNRSVPHTFGSHVFVPYSLAMNTVLVGNALHMSVMRQSDLNPYLDCFLNFNAFKRALDHSVEMFKAHICRIGACQTGLVHHNWHTVTEQEHIAAIGLRALRLLFQSVVRQRGLPYSVARRCSEVLSGCTLSAQPWNGQCFSCVFVSKPACMTMDMPILVSAHDTAIVHHIAS